ncbi:MAG: hypothetical protein OEY28_08085 [Nitrospira sp.]|nr:hypothetical protein [Nitrospira sp.]
MVGVLWSCGVMLMLTSGCLMLMADPNEDAARMDCRTLSKTFFQKSTAEQMVDFESLDLENQYTVFTCGMQRLEPPAMHLIWPFAKQGGAVVDFLKGKLTTARGDVTIRDITHVFETMSLRKTHDVAGDAELMKVIEDAVARVGDLRFRQWCERALRTIRQQLMAAP